mgnify:FL=1
MTCQKVIKSNVVCYAKGKPFVALKKKKPTGYVIYDGPSLLDGKPIVVIAIVRTTNIKTGNMVQTYILRSDMHPLEANKSGEDYSICGNCIHRGQSHSDPTLKTAKKRTCYVNLGQGVLQVYKSYLNGNYPMLNTHEEIAEIGRGRMVRIGTYGDGGAVPLYKFDSLLTHSEGHTAYGHQSDIVGSSHDSSYMMCSADNEQQATNAWSRGERTFRVISNVSELVPQKEILCPASKEMGYRTTCDKCKLCSGSDIMAKSIAIVVHGAGSTNFQQQNVNH